MKNGNCRLCKQDKELCDSHAIPNSAFRFLFRRGNGKAVAFFDDESTITDYSSDSWSGHLLCKECEEHLNERYDRYGISVLKGNACKVQRGSEGVTFTGIDRQRFRMFVLSVLWRMAISSHPAYGNLHLPIHLELDIGDALRSKRNVRPANADVGLCRLKDSTGIKALSMENLQRILVTPFPRNFIGFQSTCFLLFGFVIEIFAPRPPKKITKGIGIASGTSPVLFAPYQEVADFPEFLNLLNRGLEKHDQGLSRV